MCLEFSSRQFPSRAGRAALGAANGQAVALELTRDIFVCIPTIGNVMQQHSSTGVGFFFFSFFSRKKNG